MYRVVLMLASVSAVGLVAGLGLDLAGWGVAVWKWALGLSMLGHVVAMTFLAVLGMRVQAEAAEGRRPAWASAQAERNLWRVVPTTASAVVVAVAAGWLSVAVKPGGGGVLGLVSRAVSALAAGVSLGALGWEALSSRSQYWLAIGPMGMGPERPQVAGRFSRVEAEPEPEPAREPL